MGGSGTSFPRLGRLLALAIVSHAGWAVAGDVARFDDPLETRAERLGGVATPQGQAILAVARAGARVVGVGLRGVVIVSDDGGKSWRQASVPVQSDLVAVTFATATTGWAVGHEGVILRTEDGGETWKKQLDGVSAPAILVAHYQRRIEAGESRLAPYLAQVRLNTRTGPSLPYLDVVFEDDRCGWAVGPFGTIVRTEDAGKTWSPWLDHVDNDRFLNLNAATRIGTEVFLAGEGGMVYVLDRRTDRFVARPTGYQGSFFGIAAAGDALVAYGLRGTVYRSEDAGRSWQRVSTGLTANLTGGAVGTDGETITLVSDGGLAISSHDAGRTFRPLEPVRPMLFTGAVAVGDGRLVVAGVQGVDVVTVDDGPLHRAGR
jgi:photosystem II stability/assembly factor-like uncharacterized protein